jgi:hypothetical protein
MKNPPPAAGSPTPRRRFYADGINDPGYAADEVEFMTALDRWKRENRRPFPTCSEVLAVLKSLGYRKVAARKEATRHDEGQG